MTETQIEPIENGLAILDKREANLIELASKYNDLKINGPEDKEGYKKVHEARIELKTERVSLENDAFDLRENAVKFQKTVIAREKKLKEIISPAEKRLKVVEDQYLEQLEEIRIEKERKENQRIQDRINALAKFNWVHDVYELKIMPDEEFNAVLADAETEWKAEQARLAEKKADEEQRQKEEQEKLAKERAELARQREENERIAKDQAQREATVKAQHEARERELKLLEQERIEATRLENERLRIEREKFEAEKREHEQALRLEQVRKEAAEKAKIEAEEKVKREAAEKIERERIEKIEAARQEALKPDKEKLQLLENDLLSYHLPEVKSSEAKEIMEKVSEQLQKTSEFIHGKIKTL